MMNTNRKPILCLDFDGVIHSYDSGWQGADVIPDRMIEGTDAFLDAAVRQFRVAIYSSRSGHKNGIFAMQTWLKLQLYRRMDKALAEEIFALIEWPTEKPPAILTIDDRALTFSGNWDDYSMQFLAAFQPWNKREVRDVLPNAALREAARAVVKRWDTPAWKDVPATGVFIDALRAALAQPAVTQEKDV